MIEREGDLFTSDQRAIGHGVNCQGLMGAGIAKDFRKFYPTNYGVYKGQCAVGGLRPGGVLITADTDSDWHGPGDWHADRLIVNLATQRTTGRDAQYQWVRSSVEAAVGQLLSIGVESLALPQIGCGIGGLYWPRVRKILLAVEENVRPTHNFEFEVWTYKE